MAEDSQDLDYLLLQRLLENELATFRRALESESPGLSEGEIERYMRAAKMFSSQLLGAAPRTRGRSSRDSE